ncbi:MAG: tripartite tricarboxylate transporter substrate binding protein, partial [Betaproteobacteria bacterium]
MPGSFRIARLTLVALVLWALAPVALQAQPWPARPIKVIVPFSAGGAVDGPMRVIAQELGKRLGQQVV